MVTYFFFFFDLQISEECIEDVCDAAIPSSEGSSLQFPVPRQLSQTHSEPDTAITDSSSRHVGVERSVTWAEPRIKVIPPTSHGRSMLMAMHTEYTRYSVLNLICVRFFVLIFKK